MTSSGPIQPTYVEVGTAAGAIRDRDGGKKRRPMNMETA